MRVTNEQAKAVIACSEGGMDCPSSCPNYGIDDCPIGDIADYMLATDLLEARELIKEMRAVITNIKKDFQPHYHDCVDDGLPQCAWCDGDDILEKTKNYAK